MAQQSPPGSPVQTHHYPALLPPWQKFSRSHGANDANKAKKRKTEPSDTNSNEQPSTQINTHNRFAILESTNDTMETAGSPPNHHAQRNPPHPPIFINDVINIQTMTKSLERDISKEDYNLKITNNQVKILPTNPEAYRKLTKTLRAPNANFHTYQLKEERPFRVVLHRNIHHSADIDELKTELSKLGHEVINVSNIRHRVTKDPLSLFFIDLKQKPNNKEIYNTSRLMNAIVKFEPPQIKKEIVQCKRCQRYGHTQKYGNHTFRCVKCAGTHPTDQCRKSSETPAKCIHCQGDHHANYKGCSAYKTLYSNKYPKLRTKEVNYQTPSSPKFTFTPIPPTNQTPSPTKLTTPSTSYALAVQGT